MYVVNKLKAETGSIGVHLLSDTTKLNIDVSVEKLDTLSRYTAIVTHPDEGTITAIIENVKRGESTATVYNAGKQKKCISTRYGCDIFYDYYKIVLNGSISSITLAGTDAFGQVEWNESGCEVCIDLSDDRISDDTTSEAKLSLIAIMVAQTIIGAGSPAMKCEVYKKYYDSLTSN